MATPPLPDTDTLTRDAIAMLETLVGFDTTSRHSNLAFIEWVENYLSKLGVTATRIPNAEGTKANLYATLGPMAQGGVVLSGHSDVVPVDGQNWSSDPFRIEERGGRIFGRGTCDMKGFLALALTAAPCFRDGNFPVHLAFSYDEEVGCQGAPSMIAAMADHLPPPRAVIVGEPTEMALVTAHKGIALHEVTVTGHEAHSSLTHLGVSANMAALELARELVDLAARLERDADPASPFVPPHPTLTIGQISGGTASNILARECKFVFDLRSPPGHDVDEMLGPFRASVAAMDARLKTRHPDAGASIVQHTNTPPLAPEDDSDAMRFVRTLTGDNGPARVVSYAAEAGQFQQADFSTVICGPGSIEQAHQPDEYIARSEMERGAAFMLRLAQAVHS